MNMMSLLAAVAVVGIVGLVIGILLGVAGEIYRVEADGKELQVRAELPGSNCGGCGFPGCDGLAAAIAKGMADVGDCPVGGAAAAERIATIMGVDSSCVKQRTAFVKCFGSCEKTVKQYNYYGAMDCRKAADVPGGGEKSCSYGCMGLGSCVTVCEFDAIHIVDGIAVADKEKCVACGKCAKICPKTLIDLIPYKAENRVACSSHDQGRDVKVKCSAGCIGCTLCTRQCEFDAIHMDHNLAVVDYEKCTNCGKCAVKCPVKVIG